MNFNDYAIKLSQGNHRYQPGFCVMEAVSYIAGEDKTDEPRCVSPDLSALMRQMNDFAPTNELRQHLLRFVPRLIGATATNIPIVFVINLELKLKHAKFDSGRYGAVFTKVWLEIYDELDLMLPKLDELPAEVEEKLRELAEKVLA